MKAILILLLIASCGKQEDKRCLSQKEARLRCYAEKVGQYWPQKVPDFENKQCDYTYPVQGCY